MIKWMLLLAGLILIPGVSGCNSNELSVTTSAGFVNLEITQTPTIKPVILTPTNPPVPTETQTPTPTLTVSSYPASSSTPQVCFETVGQIEEYQLQSDLLEDPLEYLVYLPPCYLEHQDRYYPVLYLIHGQTYTNRHWIDLGVASIADRLITSGEIAPFIMVFPYDRDHYRPPPRNNFGEAVLFDLIPAIDQQFRSVPSGSSRAIGGISRGGNWAAHLSLQYPEVFGAVGLHSAPIFYTDTNREIIEWLESIPLDKFPRLFLDVGQNDRWLIYALEFEELLTDASIPHEWHLNPGFHDDKYWEAHMEQYIRWYTISWSAEDSTN